MKVFGLIAAVLLASVAPVGAVETCRGDPMPPPEKRAEPTVAYQVAFVARDVVARYCGDKNIPWPIGCAYEDPESPHHWMILIADSIKNSELQCVLTYEKAHLPPNNWFDPDVEYKFHFNPN